MTGLGMGAAPQGDGFIFNGLTFATADNQELKLFGVGSRGRGAVSIQPTSPDANGASRVFKARPEDPSRRSR